MFHKQQGNPDVVIPVIDHRPLDVWALRKEVANQGGADKVRCAELFVGVLKSDSYLSRPVIQITINKGWGSVARALSYTQAHAPHLKSAYVKIVQPFDEFYERVKGAPLASVIDRKTEREGKSLPVEITNLGLTGSTLPLPALKTPSPPMQRLRPPRRRPRSNRRQVPRLQNPRPSDHFGMLPRRFPLLLRM